jgi:hypothetical protein
MNAGGALRMSGEMVPILISGKGFYAKVTNGIFARGMPDLPLKYRLRSAWYELALRVRIAFVKGFLARAEGRG